MARDARAHWLLLIHQLPPKPDYLRVKVSRRLAQVGAVAVKSTVYALPAREDCREAFHWLREEIAAAGGEALVCEVELLEGMTSRQIERLFHAARDHDYAELAAEARRLTAALDDGGDAEAASRARAASGRLADRLERLRRIDHCGAPGRREADDAVALLARALAARTRARRPTAVIAPATVRGRTWVTRAGVEEDRIASAWLVRRFIDPRARFRFEHNAATPPRSRSVARAARARRERAEIRFDTYGGEFTHDGDRCTFEVLLDRCAFDDPALAAIGEIVHDIDLGDEKFSRPETAGVERAIRGIVASEPRDERRLARGLDLFDALYAAFTAAASGP